LAPRRNFLLHLINLEVLMKSLSWKLCLLAGISFLTLFGNTTPVFAAEENPPGPGDRLQRLEERIRELAERQEQMMRGFGALQDRQKPMPSLGPENIRFPVPPTGPPGPMAPTVLHKVGEMMRLIILVCILCNILLAIWIFTDIRKRGEGSGIFIALALVAGIPAAVIYSLVRLGDKVSLTGKQLT
jgi:hypothetical protein